MATVDKMAIGQVKDVSANGRAAIETDQMTLMRDVFLLIGESLGGVEEILHNELQSGAPFVGELLEYVAGLGGKRMRPCLLLLTAKATGGVRNEHKTLAAVVEMIHTATLVHDDVLDGADTRRHKSTVNSRWGNQAAVLLGDYLFTHAFYLASNVDTEACQTIGKSTNTVCAGEMRQVGQRGNLALTEEEYFEIIRDKTAELCACCCELGARYSGASPDVVQAMKQFGQSVGTAFQVADDILDLRGDEHETGKSIGTDLTNQKMTLPVIHALSNLDPTERLKLTSRIETDASSDETMELLRSAMANCDSVGYAMNLARQFVDEAIEQLACVPDSPAKASLIAMANFVLTRNS